jgi:hypothetical protein
VVPACGSHASKSDATDAAPSDAGAPDEGAADLGTPDAGPSAVDASNDLTPAANGLVWQSVEPFGANIGPVTTCDTSKPFGAPAVIQGFTMDDYAFSFSKDLLTMYLTSSGGHAGDFYSKIFIVTRPSVTAPFDRIAGIPFAIGTSHDAVPGPDGHRIYWLDTYNSAAFWDPTKPADDPSARGGIGGLAASPFSFSGDGKLVYFSKGSAETGSMDLHVTEIVDDIAKNQRLLANVNSTDEESGPVVTADGLTLYFSSNRPGGPGPEPGYFDVYVARRAKATDPFGPAELVNELNTPRQDYVLWVSPDGCTIYLRRIAEGANRSFHVATRGK